MFPTVFVVVVATVSRGKQENQMSALWVKELMNM